MSRTEKLKEKNKSGRGHEHKPNELTRAKVVSLLQVGVTQTKIADHLGISFDTLKKYYDHELKHGVNERHQIVVGKLFQNIQKGKEASIMFYLKTQLGWKETQVQEHTIPQMRLIRDDSAK